MDKEIRARFIRRDGFIREEVISKIEGAISFPDLPVLEIKPASDTNPTGVTIKERRFILKRQYTVVEYEEA